jgi:hypothetical protein
LHDDKSWVHLNVPAIAIADECWNLSDGRTIARSKGEALAPELADKEQIYQHMLRIGAYRSGAEYQQNPFESMNEHERRYGAFGGRADVPNSPFVWFGWVPEREIMAYEVFDVGACDPAPPPRPHPAVEDLGSPIEVVEDDA